VRKNTIYVAVIAATILLGACSKNASDGTPLPARQADGTPLPARPQDEVIAEALAPDKITDAPALTKEFKQIEGRYSLVADYLSRQEIRLLMIAASQNEACTRNELKDRLILTTAAEAVRRSMCPANVLTPSDVSRVRCDNCRKNCYLSLGQCLRIPIGNPNAGAILQSCTSTIDKCARNCSCS